MLDWPPFVFSVGSIEGDSNYNPSCDFNNDGQVNEWDFMIFRANFGEQQENRGRRRRTRALKTLDKKMTLKFSPQEITAKQGEIITLEAQVQEAKNSLGGEIHLRFNPQVLEVSSVKEGDWPTDKSLLKNTYDNSKGIIDYAVGTIKPEPEDKGTLLTISFKVKAEGESIISFDFDQVENRNTIFVEKEGAIEVVSDKIEINVLPSVSILLSIYPNPAENGCYIPFMLSEDSNVTVEVYNILGQKVKTIEVGYKKAGLYIAKEKALSYNLQNDRGDKLSQGLYFINLKAGKYSGKGRLVIQR
ncbi:T9SS type A sorting domain-containing protein [Candidatus Desantisbacteria bacterium]|nr:T9SS type A sorting domain-containing protein [Candidatus Desantisbacteria bacterium]